MDDTSDTARLLVEFPASERFELRGALGRGGMGVVYHVYDRERRLDVALKRLSGVEPRQIFNLKREFRMLADVTHPNLVSLYELFSTGGDWYFTMELVRGRDFERYVAPHERWRLGSAFDSFVADLSTIVPVDPRHHDTHTTTLPEGMEPRRPSELPSPREPRREQPEEPAPDAEARALTRVDVERLKPALRQLVAAVSAIHRAGKLHLDLKPSNVLVEDSGRVVVLDFGLVREQLDPEASHDSSISGTPAYMAPEQAAGAVLTPAADWYAVGMILYHALCHQFPFAMNPRAAMLAKQTLEPAAPSRVVAGVPKDLDELVLKLLALHPDERAGAAEILAYVGEPDGDAPTSSRSSASRPEPLLVGRGEALARLEQAFQRSQSGVPVMALARGRSGMGKTALLNHFLQDLARNRQAFVLAGRCYERESVPFKAFDSVMDALSAHLRRLPRAAAAGLLPRGVHDLARVFAVLNTVDAIWDVPQRGFEIPDPQELRSRAFRALKELLSALSDRGPLVIYVDDLQWADIDSAQLLAEVLAPPDAPPVLIAGTYRSEEESSSAFLRSLLKGSRSLPGVERVVVDVHPLAEADVRRLASQLLPEGQAGESVLSALTQEAEGSPFFVEELVRHVASGAELATQQRGAGLDAVLAQRVAALPDNARALLEVISVAGRPIEQRVAARVAGAEGDFAALFTALRAQRFVRTRGARPTDEVETYHDRVREVSVAGLDAARRRLCHLRLARELETLEHPDPESLTAHYLAAELPEQAARYAPAAAEQAAKALAFDEAARLYRLALKLESAKNRPVLLGLNTKLGDALLNAGRGGEAARAYLSAAELSSAEQALELERKAAEAFLISGHTDQGMAVLQRVVQKVGLPKIGSPKLALASLLFKRGKLRLRGLRFHERAASEVPEQQLRQIDICYTAALGLSVVDWIQGAAFQAQQLLLALSAGEPNRIALGLAFEAGHVGCSGGPTRERALHLIEAAESLTRRLHNPQAEGFTQLMKGVAEWGVGRWSTGLSCTENAERILREQCIGVPWQINTARLFSTICMTSLGDLEKLGRCLPAWLRESEERGDRYGVATLSTFWGSHSYLQLAADDPASARRHIDDAMRGWSQSGFHAQHYYEVLSRSLVDFYEGRAGSAWWRVQDAWPLLTRSLLTKVEGLGITALYLRGSAAVNAAAESRDRSQLLKSAERDAKELERLDMDWSIPLASAVRAGVAHTRRDLDTARRELERAAARFDSAEMAMHAAAARRLRGGLEGGELGLELSTKADEFFGSQQVRHPESFVRVLIPGF